MIRAKGHRRGQPFVLLGLEKANVLRLLSGQPIEVKAKSIGETIDILIIYGQDSEAIVDDMRRAGVTLPDPESRHDPDHMPPFHAAFPETPIDPSKIQ